MISEDRRYYRVIVREVVVTAYEVFALHGADAVALACNPTEGTVTLHSDVIEREVLSIEEEAE